MRHHMSIPERAKQFMSFSALKGYEEAIAEKQVIKHERVILGEDAQQELDMELRSLRPGDYTELLYFEDGDYKELEGKLHKIDGIKRTLLIGGKEINIEDVYKIKART